MNKITTIFIILLCYGAVAQEQRKIIDRQGQVSFFSYTAVENIEAVNNTVQSVIDLSEDKIAIQILMRSFVFKKALMQEQFNESYVESDIYPKLTFIGNVSDIANISSGSLETRMIKGQMTFHGVTKETVIKAKIENDGGVYIFSGDLDINISDYKIKVPGLLAPNIAKIIKATYRFEYNDTNENQ